MTRFIDFKDYIIKVIKEKDFESDIVSIICYGSMAQNNYENGFSDIDLWFVIKDVPVKERVKLVKKLLSTFDKAIVKYMNLTNNIANSCHESLCFTKEEFVVYYKSFPTRVIYPLKKGIWQIVYGEDLLVNVDLPSYKDCLVSLQYDYDILADDFYHNAYNCNTRNQVKLFLRAIKKAIWILKGAYLPNKDIVLDQADIFLGDDSNLINVINLLRDLKKNNYNANGEAYLQAYLGMACIIEKYGEKIYDYIIENGYELLDNDKFHRSTTWGNYAFQFPSLIHEYCALRNKKDYLFWLTEDYPNIMRYFDYMVQNNEKCIEIHMYKKDVPPKRSKILNPIGINRAGYQKLYELNSYQFLLGEHRNRIINNDFCKFSVHELKKYSEEKYLPAIYEIYLVFLNNLL